MYRALAGLLLALGLLGAAYLAGVVGERGRQATEDAEAAAEAARTSSEVRDDVSNLDDAGLFDGLRRWMLPGPDVRLGDPDPAE
jgi:hypothetical protein